MPVGKEGDSKQFSSTVVSSITKTTGLNLHDLQMRKQYLQDNFSVALCMIVDKGILNLN